MDRLEALRERLTAAFSPLTLEIVDDSHRHVGHTGARSGGHFSVRIVSDAFDGHSAVARHRQVYAAVGELMGTQIHALSIRARTPAEAEISNAAGQGTTSSP